MFLCTFRAVFFLIICFAGGSPSEKLAAMKAYMAKLEQQIRAKNGAGNNSNNEATQKASDTKVATDADAKSQSQNPRNKKGCLHLPLKALVDVAGKSQSVPDPKQNGVRTKDATMSAASSKSGNGKNDKKKHDQAVVAKKNAGVSKKSATAGDIDTEKIEHVGSNKTQRSATKKHLGVPTKDATMSAASRKSGNDKNDKKKHEQPVVEKKNAGVSKKSATAGDIDTKKIGHVGSNKTQRSATEKAAAVPENAGTVASTLPIRSDNNASETSCGSESSEDDGEIMLPCKLPNGKWEHVIIDNIKKVRERNEGAVIEVPVRIQTGFCQGGQYEGDVLRLKREFVLVWHFFVYSFNFLLSLVGSAIIELWAQRVTNEAKKKKEDKIYMRRQQQLQQLLLEVLYCKVTKYGWVCFEINSEDTTNAFWRIDRRCNWGIHFKGGAATLNLEVVQPIVDLELKKQLNKVEMKLVPTANRFKRMSALQMILFCKFLF